MVDNSLPMRVEESNQCESPISIARERSSYSKRFVKLLQDFQHFIQKLDFLGLNTKVSIDTLYGTYKNGNETGTTPRGVVIVTHSIFVFRFRFFDFYKKLAEFCNQSRINKERPAMNDLLRAT